jgi:integrase
VEVNNAQRKSAQRAGREQAPGCTRRVWPSSIFASFRLCQAMDDTFPTITPHDLRHTAASLAVSAHANVKAVQRMLGTPKRR